MSPGADRGFVLPNMEEYMKVDRKKFENHINKFALKPCPLCGQLNWTFVDMVFQLPEFNPDPDDPSIGKSYPVVPVMCETCGNTIFISAIVAGLARNIGKQS